MIAVRNRPVLLEYRHWNSAKLVHFGSGSPEPVGPNGFGPYSLLGLAIWGRVPYCRLPEARGPDANQIAQRFEIRPLVGSGPMTCESCARVVARNPDAMALHLPVMSSSALAAIGLPAWPKGHRFPLEWTPRRQNELPVGG